MSLFRHIFHHQENSHNDILRYKSNYQTFELSYEATADIICYSRWILFPVLFNDHFFHDKPDERRWLYCLRSLEGYISWSLNRWYRLCRVGNPLRCSVRLY